jgi:hypothetical protein
MVATTGVTFRPHCLRYPLDRILGGGGDNRAELHALTVAFTTKYHSRVWLNVASEHEQWTLLNSVRYGMHKRRADRIKPHLQLSHVSCKLLRAQINVDIQKCRPAPNLTTIRCPPEYRSTCGRSVSRLSVLVPVQTFLEQCSRRAFTQFPTLSRGDNPLSAGSHEVLRRVHLAKLLGPFCNLLHCERVGALALQRWTNRELKPALLA